MNLRERRFIPSFKIKPVPMSSKTLKRLVLVLLPVAGRSPVAPVAVGGAITSVGDTPGPTGSTMVPFEMPSSSKGPPSVNK